MTAAISKDDDRTSKRKQSRLRRCARFGRDKCADCDETDMNADNCDVIAQRERREKRKNAEDRESD